MDLTVKEIFNRVVNFQNSPRTLKWEFGYLSLTIPRWYREGLPREDKSRPIPKVFFDYAETCPRPFVDGWNIVARKQNDVSKYFKLDEGLFGIPINYWIYPLFEKITFYEDNLTREVQDDWGIKKREYKDLSSMPLWLEFSVKNRSDWETIKEERFNLDNMSERFFPGIDKDVFLEEARNSTAPLVLYAAPAAGFFGSLRTLMGDKKILMTYYDDPGLIKDMAEHLCELWFAIAEELTEKLDFDILYFWEDMSYKQGSLISPDMIRKYMLPYYKRIIDFMKSKGTETVMIDTDGYVGELIEVFGEVGVNLFTPFERQAGNDLMIYRKKYPNLIMMGGFDKNTLFKGKEYIDKELKLMTDMIKMGGFIPHADHWIPHNASWENFKYYRNRLNEIIDSTEVL